MEIDFESQIQAPVYLKVFYWFFSKTAYKKLHHWGHDANLASRNT